MTKKHTPKNRSRHSRTNGCPPSPRMEGPFYCDGKSFTASIPLALQEIDSIELWFPRGDEMAHYTCTVATALALSSFSSPLDSFETGLVLPSTALLDASRIEQHDYVLANGIAHTVYVPDLLHLQVVVGCHTVDFARDFSIKHLTEGFDFDYENLPLFGDDFIPGELKLRAIAMSALDHFGLPVECAVQIDELFPFIKREQRIHPYTSIGELLELAVATYQRLHKRVNTTNKRAIRIDAGRGGKTFEGGETK